MKAPQSTLEQLRAEAAWTACADYKNEHVNAAKSLPALIMNSGLMQVLAFCHEKRTGVHRVGNDLRTWLTARFPQSFTAGADYVAFMQALLNMDTRTYQMVHTEALAWLKWLRQLSAARNQEN